MAQDRFSEFPQLQEAFSFPLFEAIYGRRSRRFGVGMEIKEGPNQFKSAHEPLPLTPLEEALLLSAGTGVTGFNLADMPHTPRPEVADERILQWDGMCNTMVEHVGRTWGSPCGNHGTELFYTNDDGVYLLRLREAQPTKMQELATNDDREGLLKWVEAHRVKLRDGRLDLPRNTMAIMSFNLWNCNLPGTTMFMPVTDLTEEMINGIMLMTDLGGYVIDDYHDYRPCGNERWVKEKHIDENNPLPLSWVEKSLMVATCVEAGFIGHNILLAQQALGLGGWLYGGVTSMVAMGGTPLTEGLGFRFEHVGDPRGMPHPVGVEGVFESFRPPYFPDMRAAVDAVVAKKFGSHGTFNPSSDKGAPYLNRGDFLRGVPKTPEKTIECTKDICTYIWNTYGRFPATVDPMILYAYIQAQHIELDFYDKYYRPGSYLTTHRDHMKKWHGAKAAAGKRAA